MNLSSSAFNDTGFIPREFSKRGGNISPPLECSDIPQGTVSIALICHDPDAPRQGGFTHWVVWNVPPEKANITENHLPEGSTEGQTDWGSHGWGGPQPPSGTHRYIFYAYALDTALDLPVTTDKARPEQALSGHILDSAQLIGLYAAE